jgi:hypothetical protein
MIGRFPSKKDAEKYIKNLEKMDAKNPRGRSYRFCYFKYNKHKDGSFDVTYSDPGEGEGW